MKDVQSFLYKTELSQLISISWAAFIVTLSIKYLPQGSCSNKSRYSGQLWVRKKSGLSINWKVSGLVPGYLSLQFNVSLGKIWGKIYRVWDCEWLKSAQRYGINVPHESVCEHSLPHKKYSGSRGRPEKCKINTSPSLDKHAEFRWNKICYINKIDIEIKVENPNENTYTVLVKNDPTYSTEQNHWVTPCFIVICFQGVRLSCNFKVILINSSPNFLKVKLKFLLCKIWLLFHSSMKLKEGTNVVSTHKKRLSEEQLLNCTFRHKKHIISYE